MTKLIIVEGMDNTGKSTLINQYKQVRTALNPDVKIEVIHMEKPPQDISKEELSVFQHNVYMKMIDNLRDLNARRDPPDYIILDRAWISEYVYGPYYRNRDKTEIILDNLVIEERILDLFGNRSVYLIFLYVNNLDFIKSKEDGKSLAVVNGNKLYPDIYGNFPPISYAAKDAEKRAEQRKQYIKRAREYEDKEFRYCFDNLTMIKNKLPIKANLNTSDSQFDNSMIIQMFDFIHNQ